MRDGEELRDAVGEVGDFDGFTVGLGGVDRSVGEVVVDLGVESALVGSSEREARERQDTSREGEGAQTWLRNEMCIQRATHLEPRQPNARLQRRRLLRGLDHPLDLLGRSGLIVEDRAELYV